MCQLQKLNNTSTDFSTVQQFQNGCCSNFISLHHMDGITNSRYEPLQIINFVNHIPGNSSRTKYLLRKCPCVAAFPSWNPWERLSALPFPTPYLADYYSALKLIFYFLPAQFYSRRRSDMNSCIRHSPFLHANVWTHKDFLTPDVWGDYTVLHTWS